MGKLFEPKPGTDDIGVTIGDFAKQIALSHHYWVIDGQLETFSVW